MNKKSLTERDICSKFITPALKDAGWEDATQIREEVSFTKGRIIVRGKLVTRGKASRADYLLSYKPNIPIAVIEAKDNTHSIGDGIQQALGYAETLRVPFAFSSNGDGFVFHDRTGAGAAAERTLALSEFPRPEALWKRYCAWRGLSTAVMFWLVPMVKTRKRIDMKREAEAWQNRLPSLIANNWKDPK